MKNVTEVLYIGLGGFCGAVSRVYVSGVMHRIFGKGFPYGTLAVNSVGSFLLGLISYLAISRHIMGDNMRMAVTLGFLGAFTTFSTFSYETFDLIKAGNHYLSLVNIITNILICIIMVALGFVAATLIDKAF